MEKIGLKMKLARALSGRVQQQSLGVGLGLLAVVGCFLLPYFFNAALKSNLDAFSFLNLQPSMWTSSVCMQVVVKEEINGSYQSGTTERVLPLALKEEKLGNQSSNPFKEGKNKITLQLQKGENKSIVDSEIISFPVSYREMQSGKNDTIGTELTISAPPQGEKQRDSSDNYNAGKFLCDFSQERSDTCSLHGDVRIPGRSSSIILASASQSFDPSQTNPTTVHKIRPYARKWEPPLMDRIKELTLTSFPNPQHPPRCTLNHTTPAIVFSTGGFLGNFFRDFTDVLIPLFITSRHVMGEVHFLVTDFNYKWVNKYRPILRQLSRYDIINLDRDKQVHCFPQAQVGLTSHKELGIDPSKTPKGYSMADFRELLRSSLKLKRKSVITTVNKKPRVVIVFRKGSRSIVNRRAVITMARRSGFRVVAAGPEETKNLTRFAGIVNSCDVMMGVHGAGLANMVFLPAGAAVVQIVPWGGLKWACRHDFGEPASGMGLKYLEYEIKEEESSLIEQYPRDHAVFTDPLSIHKQGWNALWSLFLDKQKVRLDVHRFRGVLLEALQTLH